jgi:hypothetical protein
MVGETARRRSISPELVESEKWRRWDGKVPQTMLGLDPIVRMSVPGRQYLCCRSSPG